MTKVDEIHGTEDEAMQMVRFLCNEGVEANHTHTRQMSRQTFRARTPTTPAIHRAIINNICTLHGCWFESPEDHPLFDFQERVLSGQSRPDDVGNDE